ncbi:hypothetical protein AAF712_015409 [Marasmius tenuissimus]|uniref:Uncharacterized protein n=1 Tax=Marasmius tenuissimus TaxID=585030 RepID=A0ABR2ZAJ9_9AGAR
MASTSAMTTPQVQAELHATDIIVHYTPDPDTITPISANVPTFQAFYKYGGNAALRERRLNAYQWVSNLIDGNPDYSKLRLAQRHVLNSFKVQSQLLSEVLTNILLGKKTVVYGEKDKKTKEPMSVYSLDPAIFEQLSFSLFKARHQAKNAQTIKGRKLPEVPAWPDIGGTIGEDFLDENDIELLGIVYRGQIEAFLAELTEVYDPKTGFPVSFHALDQEYEI